jgi:hypothetical protein
MSTKPEGAGAGAESGRSSETGEMDGTKMSSRQSTASRMMSYLDREIDSKATDMISVYACFLTGYTSAHSFSVSLQRYHPRMAMLGFEPKSLANLRHVTCGVDFKRAM